jgi:RNA recognition motif-containing protein
VDYTEKDIHDFFAGVGGIESVSLVLDGSNKLRPFCFVNFMNREMRDRASMLTGKYLLGKQITLRLANQRVAERLIKGPNSSGVPMTPGSNQLYFAIKDEERTLSTRAAEIAEAGLSFPSTVPEEVLEAFPELPQHTDTMPASESQSQLASGSYNLILLLY